MNRARASVCCLLALPLAACHQSGYAVDVRNRSPQPVFVEMLTRTGPESLALLASARLGPGDRTGLGPASVNQNQSVIVRADAQGNTGHPAVLDLRPGTTVVDVTQDGPNTTGQIRLREVPR